MRLSGRRIILFVFALTAAAFAAAAGSLSSLRIDQMKLTGLRDPSIVIRKSARTLEIYDGQRLVQTIPMVLGSSPDLDKETEGDGRTPEGEFYVFTKNPKSRFHLSLGISYPAPEDAERGFAGGIISKEERELILSAAEHRKMPLQKTRLGGEIYIHGGGSANDWTDGCIALENAEMTELFEAIPVGARVTIVK